MHADCPTLNLPPPAADSAGRILIVDGLPAFRDLLADALGHDGYEVVCAACGTEAQRLVPQYRPSLILLDPALPDMDGFEWLRSLRSAPRTANIAVIILATHADRQHVIEAAKLKVNGYVLKAHLALADLRQRVRAALPAKRPSGEPASGAPAATEPAGGAPELAPRPASHTRQEVLERIRRELDLKAVPPVLQHVLSIANSNESSLNDMVEAVRQDQALTIRVLKLANSSLFGRGKPVQNLVGAMQRIGFTGVRNVVASILTVEHFSRTAHGGINAQRFWEHSLAVGLIAEIIAQSWNAADHEHLFLAGLLHDIGRAVLSTAYPEDYHAALTSARKRRVDVSVCEREMFGITHAELTREVLREWRTPDSVREAAWPHELAPERVAPAARRNAVTIGLADRLSHALLLGDSGNAMLLDYSAHLTVLGLGEDQVSPALEQAIERTSEITMFYLARSSEPACDPLQAELPRAVGRRLQVAVLSRMKQLDPVAIFCRQAGWLDENRPRLVVLRAADEAGVQAALGALAEVDARLEQPARVMLITDGASLKLPDAVAARAAQPPLALPLHYEQLIAALSSA